MDTRTSGSTPPGGNSTTTRRKRRNGDDAGVRYFLPKSGSSASTPELGQEVASEGEALIQAFRSGQTFYTLTAWKAVPEVNGGGSPVIVKQAVAPKQVQS
jgi:hypothetical protein